MATLMQVYVQNVGAVGIDLYQHLTHISLVTKRFWALFEKLGKSKATDISVRLRVFYMIQLPDVDKSV